ncbi:hypothetical protein C0992_003761 [Termitomyces sp. T32_za158]|nr:hypothetical protein C0992_003761 [Termitomyces sp. T32_za158]
MTSPRASPDALANPRTHPNITLNAELQRICHLFSDTSPISEAEFVINCKSVMNLLHYCHAEAVERHHMVLLVEVIENAILTFVLRILPLVFQELIVPTSLLHPISPPMLLSLLEVADAHVSQYGDFVLQLRMAAARLLLQDNEDVVLALSMCQLLPRIQPNVKWQPIMNPIKANLLSNLHGSISLPEIHPVGFPDSPSMSQDGTSLFGSTIPSLSSLLNCTASSSASLSRVYQYDPNHINVISESVSQPTLPVVVGPSLVQSSSAPNIQIISTPPLHPSQSAPTPIPPIVVSEGVILQSDSAARELFFPPLFGPDANANDEQATIEDDKSVLPDIHVKVTPAEVDFIQASNDCTPFPPLSPFTSQDDLSRLIACPDVGEEPPSPSLLNSGLDASTEADFLLSIGPPPSEVDLPASRPSSQQMLLSPLSNQISSPLSSPPQIVVREDPDIFRNIFEVEVQKRPPSPYNKRLRSASNNPQPAMRRAEPSKRAVSASARRARLDPDLAALTLPPPPNPKAVAAMAPRRMTCAKRSKTPFTRRNNPIIIDDDGEDESVSRQRTASASMNKENE